MTLSTIIRSTTLAALALAATAAFSAPTQAKMNYDGAWSVVIVTQKGECDRGYRYPVQISNGSVGYAGQAGFNVNGKVGANGAITVIVSRGDKSARGIGTLSGTGGSGAWQTGGGECSGTWTAERRS